jgi:CubicO group peptidase (beta-lactamase class C family)
MITLPEKLAHQPANIKQRTSDLSPQSTKHRSTKIRTTMYTMLMLLLAHRLLAQPPAFVTDSLDGYIIRGLVDWQIPGLAVAVVKDGKVEFIKGYGVREAGKPDRVDENTLFMIGSNTKAFTATALALLEGEKKLSLDDKVRKWLPAFTLHDTLAAREANLRDMLSHRVGMKTFQGDFMYWTSDLSRREVIQKFGALPPTYGFRSRYGYCNAAFLVAGEVIPAAAGVSWEAFVRDRILKPLKDGPHADAGGGAGRGREPGRFSYPRAGQTDQTSPSTHRQFGAGR